MRNIMIKMISKPPPRVCLWKIRAARISIISIGGGIAKFIILIHIFLLNSNISSLFPGEMFGWKNFFFPFSPELEEEKGENFSSSFATPFRSIIPGWKWFLGPVKPQLRLISLLLLLLLVLRSCKLYLSWIVLLYMSSLSPSSLGVREREDRDSILYLFARLVDSPFFGWWWWWWVPGWADDDERKDGREKERDREREYRKTWRSKEHTHGRKKMDGLKGLLNLKKKEKKDYYNYLLDCDRCQRLPHFDTVPQRLSIDRCHRLASASKFLFISFDFLKNSPRNEKNRKKKVMMILRESLLSTC